MIWTLLISVVWLLFTLAFFIFTTTHFALLFAVSSLIVWLWLVLSVYLVKGKIQCDIITANEIYKNEQMGYQLRVQNTSRLPVTQLQIHLIIEHIFTGKQESHHHNLSIPAKSTEEFSFVLPQKYMGQVNIRIKQLTIKDSFTFFRSMQKMNTQSAVLIMPNPYFLKLQRIEQNQHVLQTPGMIPMKKIAGEELAELSVYKPGDSVKQIHWKLSSKVDELFVKQHETLTGDAVMMTIDFTSFTNQVTLYDEFIETFSALLYSYVAGDHEVQLLVDHSTGEQLTIDNERDAANAIKEVLTKSVTQLSMSDEQWKKLRRTYPNCIVLTTNSARSTEYQTIVISDQKEGSVA
ncbi:hypothetical protein CSV80_06510 [Sporosarcina sp. P12(2017)]|uniref:DUF58 domain-containing protein n=1 Tax=unclassified Sporosarcina TaxID=2647733 RepID=UPI000C16F538|nr:MULTISPECIES: DUF58 domain-containing protein [unclassified Sporosarcina]PIC57954.1 hypothetical protein CSV81_06655 [Sporosarcina sp. P10]PIC61337.1 hypothetical protein CSV80_06510 [Sporosarcina sp. P12(2017)]